MRYGSRSSESEEDDYSRDGSDLPRSPLEEYRRSLSPIHRLNDQFNPDYDYDIPRSRAPGGSLDPRSSRFASPGQVSPPYGNASPVRRSMSPGRGRSMSPASPDYPVRRGELTPDAGVLRDLGMMAPPRVGTPPGRTYARPSISPPRGRFPASSVRELPSYSTRTRDPREVERSVYNLQAIPVFFPNLFGEEVEFPQELANEPFSYYDDGSRPEIIVPRAKFLFTANEHSATCNVGSKIVRRDDKNRARGNPDVQKATSNISVVTVYDTYGLEVAYAFLKHLYYHKNDTYHSSWLPVYLRGSLGILLPKMLEEYNPLDEVLYLSSILMMALVALDSKQPKMMGSLKTSEVALPPELLGKILGSQRISKQTTSSVRASKCLTIPSKEEMQGRENEPVTYLAYEDTYALVYTEEFREESTSHELSLTVEGDKFILQHDSRRAVGSPQPTSDIVEYSVYDYVDVMISKGCDRAASLRMILDDISRRFSTVNDRNVNEAAAWLIQLSYDSREELTPRTIEGYDELRDEIQRLVRMIRLNM